MRIGITCHATYGGSGVLATELGKALAEKGHVVHFITSSMPIRLRAGFQENIYFHQVENTDYPLFGGQSPYALSLAAKMAEIAHQEQLDLLHVHYAIPHAISAYLAQQMLIPTPLRIVTTLHGTDITLVGQEQGFFHITRFGLKQSCAVTAVSDYLKQETEKIFYPERNIERIYNFVDTDLFSPSASTQEVQCRPGVGCACKATFLHLSNFRPVKNTLDVVKVFAKVAAQEPEVCLLMAGEGPDLGACRKLARDLGVAEKIHFLGNQADIVDVTRMGDIVLFPSVEESFGLVPLEAMSCGVPVIASNSGGLPEVLENHVTGFLHNLGDVDAMADSALRLVRDPALREKMGQAGRARALEHFSKGSIIAQYESLYERVIAEHPIQK